MVHCKRAEILQKEEDDLLIFDIREELVESALKIGYEKYMEKQTTIFTVHCATEAWLKLIDWHFYRHDPGEDPSAYPPCYIPKRKESWIPDEIPDPSPKDTWSRHNLNVVEDTPDVPIQRWPSSTSLDYTPVDEIPSEYWFPGKVNVPESMRLRRRGKGSEYYADSSSGSADSSDYLNAESEVLQKVTDYGEEGITHEESTFGDLKTTTPVDGSLHGAGDSTVAVRHKPRRLSERIKSFVKPGGKSKATLPPLEIGDSHSRFSMISDCRLRSLRLETEYEVTSEKVNSPPGDGRTKRK